MMDEIYGLLSSETDSVPLTGVKVEGDILGRGASVRVFQKFINHEQKAVEAVYKFPLPEGAAICGFNAVIDGRKIHGRIEGRNKAFKIYDDALVEGDGGYLLDQERPNIFTLSAGNLNPNAEALVEIEYVALLDMVGSQVRFFLPTTISPRYLPDDMEEDNGIPEESKLHPPFSDSVPYGLSILLNIHKGNLLKSMESPSHQLKIGNLKQDIVKVAFSSESVRMDRDLVLNMELEDSFKNMAYRYRSGKSAFLQLDLLVQGKDFKKTASSGSKAEKAVREIIFVLDCSGSMSGDSISEAKKALELCLKGLEPETFFNIYVFGSDYKSIFKKPRKYSKARLEKALTYLEETDADLGGTEILSPLEDAYQTRQDTKTVAGSIVLITDGEVGNEEKVFDLVRENQKSTRLFSIGIGAGCNEYFIKGLARAGNGAAEFIYPGERIEPKILNLFGRITQERLSALSIQWGGGTVEQSPASPVIFLESPVTVFARGKYGDFASDKIVIKAKINGQNKKWEIGITDARDDKIPIPVLWARERIRDLEESAGASQERGSRQKERKPAEFKKQVLALSKKYGLLSQSTSYVAIEHREEKDKTTGDVALRKIPVLVTVGWHGSGSAFGRARRECIIHCASIESIDYKSLIRHQQAGEAVCYNITPPDSERTKKARPGDKNKTDIVLDILSLQSAEGGMTLDEKVSSLLGIDFGNFIKLPSDIETDVKVDKFILLSTIILIRILETHFSSEYNTWSGVIRKSRDWMEDVLDKGQPTIYGENILDWAEAFIQDNVKFRRPFLRSG